METYSTRRYFASTLCTGGATATAKLVKRLRVRTAFLKPHIDVGASA
jgi:hypothetical protein